VGYGFEKLHPTINLQKLFASLTKMGVQSKPSFMTMFQMPAVADVEYVKYESPPCSFRMPAFQPSLPGPTPVITSEPFATMNKLQAKGEPFVYFFMGAVHPKHTTGPTPKSGTSERPHQCTSAAGEVELLPGCSLTSYAAMAYSAAGVPVHMFTIDYDDKPAWYLGLDQEKHPTWNNKGQFPCAYLFTTSRGSERSAWISDSGDIFKALASHFPQHHAAIASLPAPPEMYWKENVFFKIMPCLFGKGTCTVEFNASHFAPLNEYLKQTKGKFLNGDEFGLADASLSFFVLVANTVSLFFDGRSMVDESNVEFWRYLNRVVESKPFKEATGYMNVPPRVNLWRLAENIKKMGMEVSERAWEGVGAKRSGAGANVVLRCLLRSRGQRGAVLTPSLARSGALPPADPGGNP
jgi:glutathione S-transferase